MEVLAGEEAGTIVHLELDGLHVVHFELTTSDDGGSARRDVLRIVQLKPKKREKRNTTCAHNKTFCVQLKESAEHKKSY